MKEKIIDGSENIFEDIGVENPKQSLGRSILMSIITNEIKERRLTQSQAGRILNLPQSKVSSLMNGKLGLFSLEHLCKMLATLGNTVYISVRKKRIRKASKIPSRILVEV